MMMVLENYIYKDMFKNSAYSGDLETIINFSHTNDVWKYCKIFNSPPDRHCYLHLIVSSLKFQLSHKVDIDTDYLLGFISNEISQHPERYMFFIENYDANVFYDGFKRYAKDKHYKIIFGDHVPMILANDLNNDLILIEESDEGLLTIETVQSNQDCRPTPMFLQNILTITMVLYHFLLNPCDNAAMHMLTIPLILMMLMINASLSNLSPLYDSYTKDGNSNSLPSDDPSSLDEGKSDEVPNFLYRLQMHRKAHPKNLLSGYLNINSIHNKFSSVEYILQNAYVDIFGIYETKLGHTFPELGHTFPESQFHVKNYIHYRKDCSSNGGSLMMYFRSDIPQ